MCNMGTKRVGTCARVYRLGPNLVCYIWKESAHENSYVQKCIDVTNTDRKERLDWA